MILTLLYIYFVIKVTLLYFMDAIRCNKPVLHLVLITTLSYSEIYAQLEEKKQKKSFGVNLYTHNVTDIFWECLQSLPRALDSPGYLNEVT